MMKNLRPHRVGRAVAGDESGAALITALLAILVTAMFAIVMLGVLMSQTVPTHLEQATTRTAFASEAGINAAVGQLRNIANTPDAAGNVYGNRKLLPCHTEGKVSANGSDVGYTVEIAYYIDDPTGHTTAWRESAANKLTCTPGIGPSKIPTHALITSTGTGLTVANAPGSLDRSVEAVYAFKVTNNNIPGGHIYSWDKATNAEDFCLEATSKVVGANVKYVPASTCGSNEEVQLWIYSTEYRLQLASTTVAGFAGGPLCVDGTPNGSTPVKVTLQKCIANTSSTRWTQLWGWNGNASWESENSGITNSTGKYLSSGTKAALAANAYLYVWDQPPNSEGWGAFDPQSAVGAGGASKLTNQMVNALQFGRCADVTHQNTSELKMIAYPCKQDPATGQPNLAWNHKWFYNEPTAPATVTAAQKIWVKNTDTNVVYCLKSAGAAGGYVTFDSACTMSDKRFQWIRTGKAIDFNSSYTFKDGYGMCLGVDPADPLPGEIWATMKTMPCDFGLGQKWNAPTVNDPAKLGNYWELPKSP